MGRAGDSTTPQGPRRGAAAAFTAPTAALLLLQATWVSQALPARLQVLYPLYLDPPHAGWTQLAALAKQYKGQVAFTIILNVDSGPDTARRPEYIQGIKLLKSSGNVNLLGYVATGAGQCFNWTRQRHPPIKCGSVEGSTSNSLPIIYRQLADWVRFYGAANLNGFFLDEFLPYGYAAERAGPWAVKSALQDYVDLYRYIKKQHPSYVVVGNPGYVEPPFKTANVKVADILCIENSAAEFLKNDPDKGSVVNIPPGYRTAMIVNSVKRASPTEVRKSLKALISVALKWGLGYFVAVRSYDVYPADFFSAQVAELNKTVYTKRGH